MSVCLVLAALCLAAASSPAAAGALLDGPVYGGAFGMSGSDYYGEMRDRPPGIVQPDAVPALRRHPGFRAAAHPRARRGAKGGGVR